MNQAASGKRTGWPRAAGSAGTARGRRSPWGGGLFTAAWLVLVLLSPASGIEDPARPGGPPSQRLSDESALPVYPVPLHERQQAIRERITRLEGLMLKLSKALERTEPGQAQRLREALERAGRQRIKARVEQLVALFRSLRLSEADQDQRLLIEELRDLLTLLTGAAGDADRRRAERQRLEQFKRQIRALIEEQTDLFNRTRQVEAPEEMPPDTAEELERLEQRQRQAEQKADTLRRQMQGRDERESAVPGARPMGEAAQDMRGAVECLGEGKPQPAAERQESSLEKMQAALTELEDGLRQIRWEEMEETLAALEMRFRAMLEKERGVRATVTELAAQPEPQWSRIEQLRLGEAAGIQAALAGECEAIERLLIDEGTTVILPELMKQLGADIRDVAARLSASDLGSRTQHKLDEIIARLTEILEAIETRREQMQEAILPPESADPHERAPLLPGSAELKLIRSSQLRINERTRVLSAATGAAAVEELGELAARQRTLAGLARRMNERQ